MLINTVITNQVVIAYFEKLIPNWGQKCAMDVIPETVFQSTAFSVHSMCDSSFVVTAPGTLGILPAT